MHSVDLLIIGAGPAGLSTAMHLLQLDPAWKNRLIIIEKDTHPRPKLCGGGVTVLGREILDGLDLPDPFPLPHVPINEARLVYKKRVMKFSGDPIFVVYHRQEFDHYLAQQARDRGILIKEAEPVQSLHHDQNGMLVKTSKNTYFAKVVVGADGSTGVTRSFLRKLSPNGQKRQGNVAHLLEVFHLVPENTSNFSGKYARFDFSFGKSALQGYVWDFPVRVAGQPHLNRGIYDGRLDPHRPKAKLPFLLQTALESPQKPFTPELNLKGHPIHWISPSNLFSAPRILLVGDAAGVEPLFGEGIGPALAYGQIAARTLQQAFKEYDYSLQSYRKELVRSRLGLYMISRYYLAWISYRLANQNWYMHLLWSIGQLFSLRQIRKKR